MNEFDRLREPNLEPDYRLGPGDALEINRVVGASRKFDYLTFTVTAKGPLDWRVGGIVRFTHPRFGLQDGENTVLVELENQGDSAVLTLVGLRWKRADLVKNPQLPEDEAAALKRLEAEQQSRPPIDDTIPRSRAPQIIGPKQITSAGIEIEELEGQGRILHLSVGLIALTWDLGTPVTVNYPAQDLNCVETTLLSASYDLMGGVSRLRLLWPDK